MASGCSKETDQVLQFVTLNSILSLTRRHSGVFSFTFAGDMFVPVEDVHPLDALLMHEAQVLELHAIKMCNIWQLNAMKM
jgi:hypothetical protein